MSTASVAAAIAAAADTTRQQSAVTVQDAPALRGADWRTAVVTAVSTDGAVVTADGIPARRLESYVAPAVGDRVVLVVSGSGNWLAAGRPATAVDAVGQTRGVRKLTDTPRSSTATPADDPHLWLPVTANAVYELEMVLFSTGGDTGDFAAQFSVPSGTTGRWTIFGPDLSMTASGTTAQIRLDSVAALTSKLIAGSSATNRAVAAKPTGTVVVGGTSGILTFQWSQNTSDATTTTLLANSRMKLTRMS